MVQSHGSKPAHQVKQQARKTDMLTKMTLAAAVVAAAALFSPVSAAPLAAQSTAPVADSTLLTQVHYRYRHHHHHHHRWHRHRYFHGYSYLGNSCGYWRRECAVRWGWGGHGFSRCLWRHGC